MDPGRDLMTVNRLPGGSAHNKGLRTGSGKEEAKLDSIVMMPILSQTEHCARCGAAFLLEENHATACTFHANQDGEPGEYKEVTVTDELTGTQSVLQAWSCCGRHHAFAPGCSARPHTCKEVMLQIRAEASPTTRVENIDLSILKSVDISIFPNSTYDLQVHITRSLVDVLHKYFSIDDIENYEITAQINDPPEPEEGSKQGSSRWKRVRNVRRMLLHKKHKPGAEGEGDDEASMLSGGEHSPHPLSPGSLDGRRGRYPYPSVLGSGLPPVATGALSDTRSSPHPSSSGYSYPTQLQTPTSEAPHTPTSSSGATKPRSTSFSPWIRSSTPKRSAGLESSAHSDSTDSTSGASGQAKSSIFGSFFGKKKIRGVDVTSLPLTVDAEPTATPSATASASEEGGEQPKRLKFNMMRARAHSHADRPERRSITGSHGVTTALENAIDARATAAAADTTTVANRRQEGVYVKFLRLGGIQLEVSTAGFMINLTKFKAQMDEFRCQGEVLQWKTLVFNMEKHLAVSLFTNAASNSLSRFTQMFRFTGQALDAVGMGTETGIRRTKSAQWEGSEDTTLTTSMKRSALGLPPSHNDSSAANAVHASEEDKTAMLLGKKHVQGKGK